MLSSAARARKAASLARPPRVTAAAASTLGRALEFGRNLLIGPHGSRGAVPGPAIGIQPGIDGGRQSLVHPAAIGLRGTLIDRRAQETAPSGS